MRIFVAAPVAAALLLVAGAGAGGQQKNQLPADVLAVLNDAQDFELIALHPYPVELKRGETEYFGYKVLGRAAVKDAATRKNLIKALTAGMAERNIAPALCFNPRHAIHAVERAGADRIKTVDVVICFACAQLRVYTHFVEGKDKSEKKYDYLVGKGPGAAFDKGLKDLKLPRAK